MQPTRISTTPRTRYISVLELRSEPIENTLWLRVAAGRTSANFSSCRKGVVAWPIGWDVSDSNLTEANQAMSDPALLISS